MALKDEEGRKMEKKNFPSEILFSKCNFISLIFYDKRIELWFLDSLLLNLVKKNLTKILKNISLEKKEFDLFLFWHQIISV